MGAIIKLLLLNFDLLISTDLVPFSGITSLVTEGLFLEIEKEKTDFSESTCLICFGDSPLLFNHFS